MAETRHQHLVSASIQLSIASSAIIAARQHLDAAGFAAESRYLTALAVSMFDTAHDLAHHTHHPKD